jgi:hypothetical protein
MKDQENDWKLIEFKLTFEKGYSFREKDHQKVDHYIGKVVFRNGESEEFILNIDQVKSEKFINIISEQMIKTTNELVSRIQESIV